MYPGQAYFHQHNANIRRAEESSMKARDLKVAAGKKQFLVWVKPLLKIFGYDLALFKVKRISDGKDAGTNTQRES